MTTNEFHTPRARAIVNAASVLLISHDELIDALQEKLGEVISFPEMLANKELSLWAIASPLFGGEDDFDDLIHEIAHCLGATMPCEECKGECDYFLCCNCDDL